MRSASVGFQCPDCVAEGARSVRRPRTTFGGRVSADPGRVTLALIAVNVAVYLVGLAGAGGDAGLNVRFGNLAQAFDPARGEVVGVASGEYYRLLTAAFLHASLFHILFNMFALSQVGPVLEQALGRSRFLALYLLSALGGSTLSYLLSNPGQVGVGASGAIFGLFGAYYVVVRRMGGETGAIVLLLVINLVITFAVPIIDWRAHLGGLATGAALAAAFAYTPRGPQQARLHAAAVGVVALLIVAGVLLRTAALTG